MAPRAAIPVTQLLRAGVTDPAATTGIAAGHAFANNGAVFLEFNNANVAARSVTLQTPLTYQGEPVADVTLTIPGSAQRYKCGPFPMELFNRSQGEVDDPGMVYLDYVGGFHADITTRAFRV